MTYDPTSTRHSQPRSLPWRTWSIALAATAIVGVVCFGEAEVKGMTSPGAWAAAGLLLIGVITTVASACRAKHHNWSAVVMFSFAVAGVIATTIIATAAPSTSASCSSTSDCDTSYGLALPFLTAVLAIPTFACAAIGKLAAALIPRIWGSNSAGTRLS